MSRVAFVGPARVEPGNGLERKFGCMCGFVSQILNGSDVEEGILRTMRDSLIHRGPDAAGMWIDGAVGFGHRRLAVIDTEDHSNQPFMSEDGRFIINYNGEIYNYIEIKNKLLQKGCRFRTASDTEVLLKAISVWGMDVLPRLNGMFAFTLWDRVHRKLLAARDRFGEKPLYFHVAPQYGFAAASEMKALLADHRISDAIDESSLDAYQVGQYYEDTEDTFFSAIKRLKPAHVMTVDASGAIVLYRRYWTPDYEDIDNGMTEIQAVEGFSAFFKEAVRKRLRADVPVGSSLSGGLDSSAIVGCIAKIREEENSSIAQVAFSARFDDDPTISEGPFIDMVSKFAKLKTNNITPNPLRMIEELRCVHWHQEEPFLSASIYVQWCVARLAMQNQIKVLLDGQGADELLGGYQFYFRNHQLDMIDEGARVRSVMNTWRFNARASKAASLYSNASRRFNARAALTLAKVLAFQFKRPNPHGLPQYKFGVPRKMAGFRMRRQMAEAIQYNSLPMLLRYSDRNSMAFSREARLPFLDNELVEHVLRTPDKWLFRKGWQKYPLRKSSVGTIPSKICWRADKVGYAAPLDNWLRGTLKEWAHDRIFNGLSRELKHFDRAFLSKLWSEHQNGANHSWEFWKWISLNEWFCMRDSGNLS